LNISKSVNLNTFTLKETNHYKKSQPLFLIFKKNSKHIIYYFLVFLIFLISMSSGIISAQTSEFLAVQLSADVKVNPPEITLRWKRITYGWPYYLVYKKTKTSSSWGTALDSLYNERTVYSDLNVIADSAYEYKVEACGTYFTSTGYIYSGVNIPAIHNRGILILLVDDIFSYSCSAEISTLMNDLSGDGWQIIRHDLSRSATDVDIKAVISDDYNTNDNVKSVFILGHIAVPYSGNKAFDSHENHQGAWPADLFYSNMNSVWSDSSVNNSYSVYINNNNIPGDGKWDQTWISSESQLQIGRVDFYDMPAFANSEIQLMKNYLAKDHSYKMDLLNIRRRGLIYDGLGINSNEAFASNGWRNFSPLLGKDSITVVGYYQTIPAMASTAYQWVYGCGGGTFTSLNHIGSTSDFVNNPNNSIFTMFFGSGFGDWNTTDNFMRAALCSNPPALTSCWAGRPNWYFHHMSLGENIGYSTLITQNNSTLLYNNNDKPLYSTEINSNNGGVHVALLGDPSLRSDYIKPLSNLSINASQENYAGLNWVDSPDPEVIGYYAYSSESLHGFYQKLSIEMLTETAFIDSAVNNETKYYMVRPVKLQTNASGSYYNLGIGIIDSFYNTSHVNNITKNTSHSDIQSAVNDANNGDVIELDPGTYNEQVLINKEITIKNSGAKPVIDFKGTPSLVSGKLTLFEITVPNVTIDSIEFNVDLAKIGSAIIVSAQDVNNLTIKNNDINPYKSGNVISFGLRNAVNINYGSYRINGSNPSNIIAENNTISYNYYGTPLDTSDDAGFRSGFATDESGGTFNLNTIQTISQDIEARFCSSGDINITNNIINGGGVNLEEYNAGAGHIIVMGNIFDGSMGNTYSSSLRLKSNLEMKTTFVSGNTFRNHNWGISLENYRAVIIDSNIFTPASNSTVYRHITVNTKLLNTSSATVTQTAIDGTFTNNTFNSSGTPGGTGMAFYNHDSENDSYGTFSIGVAGNGNNFNANISSFIGLDSSSGPSWPSLFPENNLDSQAITTMACWDQDMNIENNYYDVGAGLQLPADMNSTERSLLETFLFHKTNNSCLGNLDFFMPVHNLTQNTYFMTIQSAISGANPADVIECEEYIYNERLTIDKPLIIQGVNKTNCIIDGTGLGTGKGIQINTGITNVILKRLTIQNFSGSDGNEDAGIYAIGGNNNLYIESVIIQNNVGGSGFYANGPVNTVTLDSVTSSGHSTGARGIVIWNGLKENITFTNCEVFGNNCCGMELQDGEASGVKIENNNIHDNADNGLGLMGMQGPGENLIKGNILLNNGRFGIEIKNPNGSGLTTGPGRIIIEDNNVSRNELITDTRDIAGIAAFRRSVGSGNADIPAGVIIQNNIVTGFEQSSTSDGFGIVVEGINHTVIGNTVSGCDVGIQRQAGHLPYPGDGDQSDYSDLYFGRGNSPQTCGVIIMGNILNNTIDARDVTVSGEGIVENLTSGKTYCSIQSAINDSLTQNGDVINIDSALYNESVIVNKEITLLGNGGNPNSPPTIAGISGQTISIRAPNVTINNLIITFDQETVNTGILAAASGSFNNLTVKNSCIFGTGTTAAPVFESFGLQLGTFGGVFYDQVNLDSNEIRHTGTSPLGRGVKTFNCYGDWKRSSITGFYSIQSGDIQGGLLNITNDSLRGETEINSTGAGTHSFSNNVCDVANAYGPGTDFALLELKNISFGGTNLIISGNKFQNYVNFGIFSGRSDNVSIDNNTFSPDQAGVYFRSIRIDSKQRTTASQTAFVSGANITNNIFNGNLASGQAGVSIELANSDNISSIGTVTLGSPGNENNFSADVSKFISLNNEADSTASDPVWTGTYISEKGKVTANVNGEFNNFDVGSGLQLPSAMIPVNLFTLEDKIQHRIDDSGIGLVTVKTNNVYVSVNSFAFPETTLPSVQRGIDAAAPGYTVNIDTGNFTEQLEINKDLTLNGQGSNLTNIISPDTLSLFYTTSDVNKPVIYVHDAAEVTLKDLTVDGAGKGNANVRFQGIGYRNAGGTVRNCEIKAIRNSIIDSTQAGVGFYAYADDGIARTLSFIQNSVIDFQKNATVFAGADLSARIDSNTITGAGAVDLIAQNGIQLSDDASGSIRFNTISSLSFTHVTYVSSGILLFQSSGQDTTSNNILTDCQMGICYIDAGGVIRENTINSTAVNNGTASYWGINTGTGGTPRVQFQPADGQDFSGNGIDNSSNSQDTINTYIFRNTLTSDGTNGTGIKMDALGTKILISTVLENIVTGWDAAVLLYSDSGATLIGTVNENNLSNNTYAVYNLTDVIQNCTCNWFGTIDSDTIASKISGTLNSSPYLTNGIDSNDVQGFQPVSGSCNGLSATTLNIKVIQEGYYDSGTKTLNKTDTVKAFLHLNFFPYSAIDSAKSTIDSVTFTGSFSFSQPSGTYYIVIKNRNTIETWSKSGGETFTAGAIMNYDFTDAITKAYQTNLVQIDNLPVRFALFSGDINQDGIIDAADISTDENDILNAVSGYVSSDVTGDDFVDASDLSNIENNSLNNVVVKKP
jgi:hypothetical protein